MATDMTPTPLQAENYAKEQKFLTDLYELMSVGVEQEMSVRLLHEITRADPARAHKVLLALQRANGYTMRFEWHDPNNATAPGKHAFWTLNIPYEDAKVILDKAQADDLLYQKTRYSRAMSNRHKNNAQKGLSNNGTAYAVGPDMPKGIGIKTFSPAAKEPKALVEAARQYGPKLSAAKQAYDLLTSSGIDIDKKTFFDTMKVSTDDRLEIVSLVLPYIDQLEAQVKQLKNERKAAAKTAAVAVK